MTKRALTACLLAFTLAGAATPALAQREPVPNRGPVLIERAPLESQNENAWQTQQDLWRVMRQYPPAVGEIIQRDPSLLEKPDYMSAYPGLAAFIEQHPEIGRNPGFYFGTYQYRERSTQDRAYNMMEDILGGLAGMTAGLMVLSVFIWLVRTIVDHRRWLRTGIAAPGTGRNSLIPPLAFSK